jgi:hypothetical protein
MTLKDLKTFLKVATILETVIMIPLRGLSASMMEVSEGTWNKEKNNG